MTVHVLGLLRIQLSTSNSIYGNKHYHCLAFFLGTKKINYFNPIKSEQVRSKTLCLGQNKTKAGQVTWHRSHMRSLDLQGT